MLVHYLDFWYIYLIEHIQFRFPWSLSGRCSHYYEARQQPSNSVLCNGEFKGIKYNIFKVHTSNAVIFMQHILAMAILL